MGISTGDWRGVEDSGAAEVERLQQQQHLQTDLCADGGYDLSDIRQHHPWRTVCEPRTVVRRRCRVQILPGNAVPQWPGDNGILAVRTLGLEEQKQCFVSRSTVSRKHRIVFSSVHRHHHGAGTSLCGVGVAQDGRTSTNKGYVAQHIISQRLT